MSQRWECSSRQFKALRTGKFFAIWICSQFKHSNEEARRREKSSQLANYPISPNQTEQDYKCTSTEIERYVLVSRAASWAWFENQPFSSLNEPLMISRKWSGFEKKGGRVLRSSKLEPRKKAENEEKAPKKEATKEFGILHGSFGHYMHERRRRRRRIVFRLPFPHVKECPSRELGSMRSKFCMNWTVPELIEWPL